MAFLKGNPILLLLPLTFPATRPLPGHVSRLERGKEKGRERAGRKEREGVVDNGLEEGRSEGGERGWEGFILGVE